MKWAKTAVTTILISFIAVFRTTMRKSSINSAMALSLPIFTNLAILKTLLDLEYSADL